jgi:hypothetical protein
MHKDATRVPVLFPVDPVWSLWTVVWRTALNWLQQCTRAEAGRSLQQPSAPWCTDSGTAPRTNKPATHHSRVLRSDSDTSSSRAMMDRITAPRAWGRYESRPGACSGQGQCHSSSKVESWYKVPGTRGKRGAHTNHACHPQLDRYTNITIGKILWGWNGKRHNGLPPNPQLTVEL